jgi:hypothetical protein
MPAAGQRSGAAPTGAAPLMMMNGQGGIRTLDTLAGMPVFETGSFNHSDTCP